MMAAIYATLLIAFILDLLGHQRFANRLGFERSVSFGHVVRSRHRADNSDGPAIQFRGNTVPALSLATLRYIRMLFRADQAIAFRFGKRYWHEPHLFYFVAGDFCSTDSAGYCPSPRS